MEGPQENPKRDLRTLKGKMPLDGVTVANLSPVLASELGLDAGEDEGVAVTAVSASGIATNLSLEPGDIIVQVNGTKIASTAQLEKIMQGAAANGRLYTSAVATPCRLR